MIHKRLALLFVSVCFLVTVCIAAVPVNPDASPEARGLLNYIYSIFGKKMLTAQMDAPFGGNETSYVFSTTGKYEAIMGIDLINESDNNGEVTKAINYWKAGGLVTVMWHWGAPTIGDGFDASKNTVKNFDNLFISGTNENKEMLSDLDRIAGHLAKLRDAKVPIIFRPMHECSGGWFWWDKSGGASFVKLWKFVFDYYTKTKGLNNMLWFLGYDGSPSKDYNPGDGYFDMVGADMYSNGGPYANLFTSCKAIHGSTIPIAMHECGVAPDPAQNLAQNCMFAWFMVWHTSYIKNMDKTLLKNIYNSDLAITRDELPKDWSPFTATIPVLPVKPKTVSDLSYKLTSGKLTFTTALTGIRECSIYSMNGKQLQSIPLVSGMGNTYNVNLPRISSGMHIVKITGANTTIEKTILFDK